MIGLYRLQVRVVMIVSLASACASGCATAAAEPTIQGTRDQELISSPIEARIPTQRPTSTEESARITATVVYDNNSYDSRLPTSWGFSCLVELEKNTILFDTGEDGEILLHNMSVLGLDPLEIDFVVLSHIHGDHTGGLGSVLATGVHPVVYMPRSFPTSFKDQVSKRTEVREVSSPTTIIEGAHSTGELGSGIIEQALVLETPRGLLVITGCAHPGIVNMVRTAKQLYGDEIYLVMGGFHLGGKSSRELETIIAELRQLGVQKVAPCHCTGDQAIDMFAQQWGRDFLANGVGRVIEIGD